MIFPLPPELLQRELLPLLFAALLGCFVAVAYLTAQRQQPTRIRIANACVILAVVICLITWVVQNLATAFIVGGALTLVRLCAATADTRELGFLLLSVAVGLNAGERHYELVIICSVIVCALALLLSAGRTDALEHRLGRR